MNRFFTTFLMLGFVLTLYAHPAKDVILEYNKETKTLKIIAKHEVNNAEKHYIDWLVVKVNGNEKARQEYQKQTNNAELVVEIVLENVQPGDEIEVITNCNKFGKKKAKIKIE